MEAHDETGNDENGTEEGSNHRLVLVEWQVRFVTGLSAFVCVFDAAVRLLSKRNRRCAIFCGTFTIKGDSVIFFSICCAFLQTRVHKGPLLFHGNGINGAVSVWLLFLNGGGESAVPE